MAWVSSYLGSNVTSDYTHIDNLRTDLITGKFWNTSGNQNIQVFYSGAGYITTTAGTITLTPSNGIFGALNSGTGCAVLVYHSGGTYLGVSASGGSVAESTYGFFSSHATNAIHVTANSAKVRFQVSGGGGQCKLEMYDVGSAVWRSVHISGGAWVIV